MSHPVWKALHKIYVCISSHCKVVHACSKYDKQIIVNFFALNVLSNGAGAGQQIRIHNYMT